MLVVGKKLNGKSRLMRLHVVQSTKTHQVFVFYLLAFLISWGGMVPLVLQSYGHLSVSARYLKPFSLLMVVGPTVAAVLTLRLAGSPGGLKGLFLPLLRWRVSIIWYFCAIMIPAGILTATRCLEHVLAVPSSPPAWDAKLPSLTHAFVVAVLANPWEEVGWRGFALPRLQARFSAVAASLVIGTLAGLWHLPLFLWPENPMSAYPYLPWFICSVCFAFMCTWLFNNSASSLLIVSLFHVSLNALTVALPIRSFEAFALVNVFVTVALVWLFGWQTFTRKGS
jgi:membrane protease YdiL (CAAX protease family)